MIALKDMPRASFSLAMVNGAGRTIVTPRLPQSPAETEDLTWNAGPFTWNSDPLVLTV